MGDGQSRILFKVANCELESDVGRVIASDQRTGCFISLSPVICPVKWADWHGPISWEIAQGWTGSRVERPSETGAVTVTVTAAGFSLCVGVSLLGGRQLVSAQPGPCAGRP